MTVDDFIQAAIAAGDRLGVAALTPDQRLVYLIAEAECLSDMDGVDSFLQKYAPDWLTEAAAAFEMIGATEIAAKLRSVPLDATAGDPRLARLNGLLTSRSGYDYEAIRRIVAERRTGR